MCAEARVKPADLHPRTYEEFKTASDYEEVAQVRHQHYLLKRLRKYTSHLFFQAHHFISYPTGKLAAVNKAIEMQAKRRQMEKERVELEYQKKLLQEKANNDLQYDSQQQLQRRPSTTSSPFKGFNKGIYQSKVNEIADGRSPKKVANDKIAFY